MDNTNIKTEFSIYGDDFNPNEITKKLKLEPNETYIKGDNIENKNLKRKETSWSIETEYEEFMDINDSLSKVTVLIMSKTDVLKQIRKDYNVKILFMFVIRIENNESPAMYFNRKFVEFAGEIGAEIGFDVYIYS